MEWSEIILSIVGGVLFLLTTFAGVKWRQTKNLLRQTGEALITVADAVEDDTVTEEEVKAIVKECKDVVDAVKAYTKKE